MNKKVSFSIRKEIVKEHQNDKIKAREAVDQAVNIRNDFLNQMRRKISP